MKHLKTYEELNIDDDLDIEIAHIIVNEFQSE
jgi:hypothetical protein